MRYAILPLAAALIAGTVTSSYAAEHWFSVIADLLPSQRHKHEKVIESLKKVRLGMTKDEVRGMVGEPESSSIVMRAGKEYEVWIFPHSATASATPKCIFARDDGKVVSVIAEEFHTLGKPPWQVSPDAPK